MSVVSPQSIQLRIEIQKNVELEPKFEAPPDTNLEYFFF